MTVKFAVPATIPANVYMLYGHNGRGKTHMIGTAMARLCSAEKKMGVIDCHGGYKTLTTKYPRSMIEERLRTVVPYTIADVYDALEMLKKYAQAGKLAWAIVDTMSDLQKRVEFDVRSIPFKSKDAGVKLKRTKSTQSDWGTNQDLMYDISSRLKALNEEFNVNVVLTALADDRKSPTRPSIATLAYDKVCGMCDSIFYLDCENDTNDEGESVNKYLCYTRPTIGQDVVARDRMNTQDGPLLDSVIEPDFEYILEKIAGAST